jgi:imidazoleglycerol-phosphate dehydratase/histidinol-phosphatase
MVTNQDGLGTEAYPEDRFNVVQDKMLEILAGEGISFQNICIDRSYAHEGRDTRKPGTGMLQQYLHGRYDLGGSYVIGDRITDIQLAKNLGAQCIFIRNNESPEVPGDAVVLEPESWDEIYRFLRHGSRSITHGRKTTETCIDIRLQVDGRGIYQIDTGLGFFNHMLEQLTRHSGIDLSLQAKGDLHIDEHHTIEDTGIALGEAFAIAMGSKRGMERYGFCLPMDDCLAQAALDFGGRSWLVWDVSFSRDRVGDVPTEMFSHFFRSFCDGARCNLNIKAEGDNDHHKIEAVFKAVARAIKMAIRVDADRNALPTTKGIL